MQRFVAYNGRLAMPAQISMLVDDETHQSNSQTPSNISNFIVTLVVEHAADMLKSYLLLFPIPQFRSWCSRTRPREIAGLRAYPWRSLAP
jgi:hypothetical protein